MDDAGVARARMERAGGLALIVGAAISVVLMMLHPSDAHRGALNAFVHGGMMLAIGALLFGFAILSRTLGLRSSALVGVIAYAVSAGAHFAAATINGFAVPAMANWPQGAPGHDVFLFAWQLNQGFANLGIFAAGLAYLAWANTLRDSNRWLAISGAICGAVPPALLAAKVITLDVHGALFAYGVQALWAIAVGVALWRGKLGSAR